MSKIAAAVRAKIKKSGLPLLGDPPIAQPGFHLHTIRKKSSPRKLGVTRMGGCPDLPQDADWPEELDFVGQVNLADVASAGKLPKTGLLSFFAHYDLDTYDREMYRVYYFEDTKQLKRAPLPDNGVCHPCTVEISKIPTLPQLEAIPRSVWRPTKTERDAYIGLMNDLIAVYSKHKSSMTWLLGNAHCFYGDMQSEISLIESGLSENDRGAKALVKRSHDEWSLLFQVGTNEDGTGYMWGDMGSLFFWIKNEDMAAGKFDNVWAMIEGG